MKRALVVGGQHAFVKNKLSKSLARHGIEITQHWAWDKAKPPSVWPRNLDLIYICTDMVSHKVSTPAVEHCRAAGIPYVNGTRKWAESIVRLTGAGFPLVNPSDSLAEILDDHLKSLTHDQAAQGPSDIESQAMLVALAGSLEMASDLTARADAVLNSNPSSPLPERVMPPSLTTAASVLSSSPVMVKPRDPYAYARDITAPMQAAYVTALLRNPDATNKQLEAAVRAAGFNAKFDPIRGTAARQACGITHTGSGMGVKKHIDEEKFLAAAIALNVNDFNLNSKPTGTSPPPAPTWSTEMSKPRPAINVPAAAPAPQVTHVATVAELVRKLKAAMAAENFTELHITESGVQFKRVQVTEGVLDI